MSAGPAAAPAVDFARASCAWLMRGQDSWGRFALDAVLTIGARDAPIERYVLTAQVFAGNVYAGEGLFKDPPYGFSAAFSAAQFHIFRDPVSGSAADSFGSIGEQFREIDIDLPTSPCRAIEPADLIAARGRTARPLSARIELPPAGDRPRLRLEFPVRHLNVDTVAGRFQVETGPVLMLDNGAGDAVARLCRAYVNFGRTDRAEFLLDSPRVPQPQSRWVRPLSRPCAVSLFEADA